MRQPPALPAWAHAADAQPAASCCRRTHARALLSDSDWSAGEDEFGSDDDVRTSSVDRGNAVLLSGPVGSGKTAAAYAVAMVRLLNMLFPLGLLCTLIGSTRHFKGCDHITVCHDPSALHPAGGRVQGD